jgi:hypothetical protein
MGCSSAREESACNDDQSYQVQHPHLFHQP